MKVLAHRMLRRPDIHRWSDIRNLDAQWAQRAELIAQLVPPSSRVVEFGAGLGHLRSYLDPSCSYCPFDLVSRGPDTKVLDLEQRPLPDLSGDQFQVAVFAGVLEYLSDVPGIAAWVARQVSVCIASYECAPDSLGIFRRWRLAWRRAGAGWVNSYSERDLRELFHRAGFNYWARTIWKTPEGDEPIFTFSKSSTFSTGAPLSPMA